MTGTQKHNLTLLKIPGHVFIESPNSHNIISFLTKVLNTGYNRVKIKFGVINSTRIKNETAFVNDLGIKSSGSFLWLVIANDKDFDPEVVLKYLQEGLYETKEAGIDLSFDELDQKQVLGTIGVKPKIDSRLSKGKGWEITGFTSFLKGVGKFMITGLEKLAIEQDLDFLFATVIQEHELVPYYAQYGYKETGVVILLEVDPETGRVKGDALEDGIYATRDFHVAELIKHLK